MALDPPITPDEEDIIRRVRSLQAKQSELELAEANRYVARQEARQERANHENLRREFAADMRERGITNPDELLREPRR